MARQFKRLTARAVATLTEPGRHADGDGLYLIVDPSGAKRWMFLFRWGGRPGVPGKLKEMGLGGVSAVSLVEARERAAEARKVLG
ncbi:MAG: Arm DNA-binding domain-containing protein, partial [Microvirga sp.]